MGLRTRLPSDASDAERLEYYLSRTEKIPECGCWIWMGYVTPAGYGAIMFNGHRDPAHRVIYQLSGRPVPTGLELDHLCRTRSCVNPDHLEPVTPKENRLRGNGWAGQHSRKTHCPKGHALVNHPTRPRRYCAECFGEPYLRRLRRKFMDRPDFRERSAAYQRAYKARKKAKEASLVAT